MFYHYYLKTKYGLRAFFPFSPAGKGMAIAFRKQNPNFKYLHLKKGSYLEDYFGSGCLEYAKSYGFYELQNAKNLFGWTPEQIAAKKKAAEEAQIAKEKAAAEAKAKAEKAEADRIAAELAAEEEWQNRKHPAKGDWVQLLREDGRPCEDFTYVEEFIRKTETGSYIIHDMYNLAFEVQALPERDHRPFKAFRVLHLLTLQIAAS